MSNAPYDASQGEAALMAKAARAKSNAKTPLDKLRYACLQRGTKSLSQLGRAFRIFDDDRSGKLEFPEFHKALHDYGVDVEVDEAQQLFDDFDTDNTGKMDYDEFLVHLRPPMSDSRKKLVKEAFNKLDKTGDGQVTIDDLKGVYSVKSHPQYLNGDKTEAELFRGFLTCFDSKEQDGVITEEEFLNYYSGISANIDPGKEGDSYFALMIRNAWKL